MGCHLPGLTLASAIPEACRGCGAASARSCSTEPGFGLAREVNVRSSDYQDPLPDSAGHDRQFVWSAQMLSRRYVLVADVSGRFR